HPTLPTRRSSDLGRAVPCPAHWHCTTPGSRPWKSAPNLQHNAYIQCASQPDGADPPHGRTRVGGCRRMNAIGCRTRGLPRIYEWAILSCQPYNVEPSRHTRRGPSGHSHMIRSMTAFGSAKAETEFGSLTIEIRSVNSRFLDLNFRLPEDLRMVEAALRERVTRAIARGKVEVRASFARKFAAESAMLDTEGLHRVAALLKAAREVLPDVPAPRLSELLAGTNEGLDPEIWTPMATEACTRALADLQASREREGQRLAEIMQQCAS